MFQTTNQCFLICLSWEMEPSPCLGHRAFTTEMPLSLHASRVGRVDPRIPPAAEFQNPPGSAHLKIHMVEAREGHSHQLAIGMPRPRSSPWNSLRIPGGALPCITYIYNSGFSKNHGKTSLKTPNAFSGFPVNMAILRWFLKMFISMDWCSAKFIKGNHGFLPTMGCPEILTSAKSSQKVAAFYPPTDAKRKR